MPALAELQSAMSRALLAAEPAARQLPAAWFVGEAERGLRTHRNNILGACVNALRQSYPTVERLIGVEYFDALAADYARHAPPAAPMLAAYGEGFAGFVAARAADADRPLLHEVAQFDWLFERVAQAPPEDFGGPAVMLDGAVRLQLCSSLRLFAARFEVDSLRAGEPCMALPDGPDAASAIRHLAVWRRTAGVAVQPLEPASAAFLDALLAGAALGVALCAANATGADDTLPAVIEREILRAAFARLTQH